MCDENESLAYRRYCLLGRGELGAALRTMEDLKGTEVPKLLAGMRPREEDRLVYLAEVERQMRNVMGDKNFTSISADQVRTCIDIIDKTVLNGVLKKHVRYTATLNRRGTFKKIGHCSTTRAPGSATTAEIAFNARLLFSEVPLVDGTIKARDCNGIICKDYVAILASVLMHEIVHLIIQWFAPLERKKGGTMWSSHGTVFMAIAKNLWGHTKAMCVLMAEASAKTVTRETARVGQTVSVRLSGYPPFRGTIQTLNPKRARVRIADEIVFNGELYKPGAIFRAHYELLQRMD